MRTTREHFPEQRHVGFAIPDNARNQKSNHRATENTEENTRGGIYSLSDSIQARSLRNYLPYLSFLHPLCLGGE
jgi:hypothetical protein